MEMRQCTRLDVTLIVIVILASIVHHVSEEVELHNVVECTQLILKVIDGVCRVIVYIISVQLFQLLLKLLLDTL